MSNDNTNFSFAEMNAAVDILIAVIALDKNIDQSEIDQFKFELNSAHFAEQQHLKAAAISYVENVLPDSIEAFDQQFISERAQLVTSKELQKTVVMAALAIAHADDDYHDDERTAVKSLRNHWSI